MQLEEIINASFREYVMFIIEDLGCSLERIEHLMGLVEDLYYDGFTVSDAVECLAFELEQEEY